MQQARARELLTHICTVHLKDAADAADNDASTCYIYTYINAYMYIYICMYIYVYIYVYIHMYACVCAEKERERETARGAYDVGPSAYDTGLRCIVTAYDTS